jgi:uncharacterized membrane protein
MDKPHGLAIAASIQFGWKTLKQYPLFVVGVTVAAWAIPSLIGAAGERVLDEGLQKFLMTLIEFAVSSTLALGLAKIYLKYRDGEKPLFENLFDGLARLHVYVGASIIMTIAIAMGLVLLVLPGIIFLIRLWFVGFVVVDEPVGPLDAIQRSWDITRGYTLDLFLLFLVLCGVNILGLICMGVGVLATIPISGLALAFVYRQLKPKAAVADAVESAAASMSPVA